MPPLPLYVTCRSEKTAQSWRARAAHYEDVEVRCVVNAPSYYALINQALAGTEDVVAVAHDDVWLSLDLGVHVAELVCDLDAMFENWGVCGNAGVRWDGEIGARHVIDPHAGPRPFGGPRPALSVDGNFMLINVRALRGGGLAAIPDLGGFHGYDLVLSLETLRRGLCVLIDGRLFAKHDSRGDQSSFDAFARGEAFQAYFAERFCDVRLATINGPVGFGRREDFEHLDVETAVAPLRPSVIEAFDAGLVAARRRRKPRLAILVRTQFKRPVLLERLLQSAATAVRAAGSLAEIEIGLISDQPANRAEPAATQARRRFPTLPLRLVAHTLAEGRASRVDLVIAAFENVEADYLWFVDDDDYLLPSGAVYVARTLAAAPTQLLVVDCLYVEEKWAAIDGAEVLRDSVSIGRTDSSKIYTAFDGDNTVPFCGLVYPRAKLREKLAQARARTAYFEDYLLSLIALSLSELSVETLPKLCCGVSLRGVDNTVTETDRTIWHLSLATVLAEVLARPALANAVAWDAYRRGPAMKPDEAQHLIADPSLGEAGAEALVMSPAGTLRRDHETARGFVDRVELDGDVLECEGWALEAQSGRAVDRVAVVFADRVIALAPTHLTRGDVAAAVGFAQDVRCGFRLRIRLIGGFHGLGFPSIWAIRGARATPLEARDCHGEKLAEWVAVARARFSAETFDEADYLGRFDDVRRAVAGGAFESGFAHWRAVGIAERREFRFAGQGDLCASDLDAVRAMFASGALEVGH